MIRSAQLSLFDTTASETGSFYKPGDWVKIKKIPTIAKHVKCGHLYKIHAVDPTDGRLQFWNPFSAQWDFLLSAEVKLAITPTDKIDSVTPAEVAVTESNCQHSETPAITQFDAVTESDCQPHKNDSVTPAEVAVTESNCQHSETPAITQFDAVTESDCQPHKNDSVTPAEVAVTESNCPPGDDYLALNAISTYRPRGTARGGEYYRLSYRDSGRVRHQHIRGGNTDSPIAQAKVQEVRSQLAAGIPPAEIATMLKKPTL
ncbi:hypothetical protein QUA43_30385 [Microcoleus sp. N9_B4]|uniref:hypothetical protein n=1 Tax=Microcoleus sp. N9_B4 TaxID=3055386 RepID=UPI002FD311AF